MRTAIRTLVFAALLSLAASAAAVTVPLIRSLLSTDTFQRLNSAQRMIETWPV
jgi:hypothetical protein